VRNFSEQDLSWIFIIKCLRGGGVQLADIRKYVALCQVGDSTIQERFEIIKEAKQKTLEQIMNFT
jgi:DNA-binding transcriptional MerR regulator